VVLAMVAFVAALAAWQGAAAGVIALVPPPTIDGVTSTTSPPGGVMEAKVSGFVVPPTEFWRATRVTFGSEAQCVNHNDIAAGPGLRTATFNLTAPGTPGSYDVGFTSSERNDCSDFGFGSTVTLVDGLRVTEPASNPNLTPRCGIDVMLVLDRSGSIGSNAEKVRNAARAFLTALSDTGAAVSIVDFSTSADPRVAYTTVTQDSIANVFEPYLKNVYMSAGWTNWEDAFQEVRAANADPKGPVADLVVFITDGDPTARNDPPNKPITGLTEGDVTALRPAAAQADLVKGQGSHVLAMGVGAAVTTPTSARRLTAVSGFDKYPPAAFGQGDYTLVDNFADLAAALRQMAVELCKASVTVTKLVDEGDGTYRPDPGWGFAASLDVNPPAGPGGYAWVQPPPPPSIGPRSGLTDKDGTLTFQWKPSNAGASSTLTLDENVKEGYQFVDASCKTNGASGVVRRKRTTIPRASVTLGANQFATCTFRNRINPGTIEIEKDATPDSTREFEFTGSGPLGSFTLVDDGKDESTASRTFANLAPGTYTVTETVPDDWELTGITCTPGKTAVITGPQVAITIAPGDAVVCTYRDTRIDPPVPPEPPIPPTPPEPPTPPTPLPSTVIDVVKTAPRTARVGERVPFSLTVNNVGSVAAQNVIMADVPPAALTLARLQSTGGARVRLARGNAYWHLGTLAPGAKRTIRGTVRITAGTPGLKRNLVLATAVNAQTAQDNADTRVLAQQRVIPPVTG
jgi:uncharacterized repeat protein (TIGR01451 family)